MLVREFLLGLIEFFLSEICIVITAKSESLDCTPLEHDRRIFDLIHKQRRADLKALVEHIGRAKLIAGPCMPEEMSSQSCVHYFA